ncbi:MAG: hypothetical protein IOC63_03760, partial [Methylobacterium sp.]|nr:hypothetical protein [Methylobacterium sp.]
RRLETRSKIPALSDQRPQLNVTRRVYVFLEDRSPGATERLVFKSTPGGQISARHFRKQWITNSSGDRIKLESRRPQKMTATAAAAYISASGRSIFSVFCKYKTELVFKDWLSIHLDECTPLGLTSPAVVGSPFFDLEFEALDQAVDLEFAMRSFSTANELDFPKVDLPASKKDRAAQFDAVSGEVWAGRLTAYVTAVLGAAVRSPT